MAVSIVNSLPTIFKAFWPVAPAVARYVYFYRFTGPVRRAVGRHHDVKCPLMRLFYLSALLLLITSFSHAQKIEEHTLHSDLLGMDRELLVYTPWQLEEYDDAKLNVIYVFDAQARSLFDLVHATVDLYGPAPMPFMVVGVKSPYIEERQWNRNTEMLPAPDDPAWVERYGGYAGKADSLLLFMKQELMPWVDATYPTLPRRVAVGHSNGATLILHAMVTQPGIFTDYLAFSPNFAYDDQQISRRLQTYKGVQRPYPPFVYVSSGNEGAGTGFNGWDTAAKAGWQQLDSLSKAGEIDLVTEALPGQGHMKSYVRALPSALEQFFSSAFQNASHAVGYLKLIEDEGHRSLNAGLVNGLAYFAHRDGKTEAGLGILAFAVERFPDDSNLLDSQGELLQSLGRVEEARVAYEAALSVLAAEHSNMSEEDYQQTKAYYEERLLKLDD